MNTYLSDLEAANRRIESLSAEIARVTRPLNVQMEAALRERDGVMQSALAAAAGFKAGERVRLRNSDADHVVDRFQSNLWCPLGARPSIPERPEDVTVMVRRVKVDGRLSEVARGTAVANLIRLP